MLEHSIENLLQKYFMKSSREDWKKIAMQETHGNDPFEVLSWRGEDEIAFSPYYDASDVAKADLNSSATLSAAERPLSCGWTGLSAVDVSDESAANSDALEHLSKGADGILFNLRNAAQIDIDTLLRDIEWPFCTLAFDLNARSGIAGALPSLFERRKFDPNSINGAFFWESIPEKNHVQFYLDNCKNIRSMGFQVPVASPATEVSTALMEGVKKLDEFGSDQPQVKRLICFSITASGSIPETAAKLKALRLLWTQVMHAYGYTDYKADELYIHVRAAEVADSAYGPHENLLHTTFAAIAAVLGGCNALTLMVQAHTPLLLRWARNVSLILREESFLHLAADPLAGSYTFDSLVDAIGRKAWKLFQEKWTRYEEA